MSNKEALGQKEAQGRKKDGEVVRWKRRQVERARYDVGIEVGCLPDTTLLVLFLDEREKKERMQRVPFVFLVGRRSWQGQDCLTASPSD